MTIGTEAIELLRTLRRHEAGICDAINTLFAVFGIASPYGRFADKFAFNNPPYTMWLKDLAYVHGWVSDRISDQSDFRSPPESRQHFDVWQFANGGDGSYFGRMPPQIVENLLWFYTDPGDIVFDPFAGSGTLDDVAVSAVIAPTRGTA